MLHEDILSERVVIEERSKGHSNQLVSSSDNVLDQWDEFILRGASAAVINFMAICTLDILISFLISGTFHLIPLPEDTSRRHKKIFIQGTTEIQSKFNEQATNPFA